MSMPFINREFTFTQPDGTQFRVRGTGDQHSAIFETLDGYTVVRDPVSGFYHYARLSEHGDTLLPSGVRPGAVQPQLLNLTPGARPSAAAQQADASAGTGLPRSSLSRWQIRRRERQSALHINVRSQGAVAAPPQRATVGQYVGLCLLVQFPDVPGVMLPDEVDAFCNKQGYNGFGNNGSVRDYYHDNSDNKVTYTNIVAPYYTAKNPRSYYTNEQVDYPSRAQELVKETLAYHLANGFDFSSLTADGANYIYAVNVFYAGDLVNNWSKGLWPHSWHLQTPFSLTQGKMANDYQITNMGSELTLGTFCHENGHMICDFPDLYSYNNDWIGVGVYCLMCTGGIPPNDKNPAQICAYLKNAAGWTSASKTIAPGSNFSLLAGRNEFAIFRRNSAEYFIIENRERIGRDVGLPGNGLAIWHVDETGSNSDAADSPSKNHECTLVQADGDQNVGDATDLYPDGSNNRLSDASTPSSKWLDGSSSSLDIQNISTAGQNMTFTT